MFLRDYMWSASLRQAARGAADVTSHEYGARPPRSGTAEGPGMGRGGAEAGFRAVGRFDWAEAQLPLCAKRMEGEGVIQKEN